MWRENVTREKKQMHGIADPLTMQAHHRRRQHPYKSVRESGDVAEGGPGKLTRRTRLREGSHGETPCQKSPRTVAPIDAMIDALELLPGPSDGLATNEENFVVRALVIQYLCFKLLGELASEAEANASLVKEVPLVRPLRQQLHLSVGLINTRGGE
ncbi:hypothetical protein KUCAC02_012596 [Chaenocephalus aceratus]|uniref:Uncharacterized protein n=1 Tax=Chaenocephalus aceratus TaxID=36190 RepID=A0ACB9XC78_CHAAC|nr:hypothetical protein KUCAC02_012596 [Chaenocephalus aceratus]